MIEMPVLFWDQGGALAYTNNVVNSLVDGASLFVADVFGPSVAGVDLFDQYVADTAALVGFAQVVACDERVYHNWQGSIHCGTNVLPQIPAERRWDQR